MSHNAMGVVVLSRVVFVGRLGGAMGRAMARAMASAMASAMARAMARAMGRALACALGGALVGVSGCAIIDNRDGIGRSCATDGACPLDHFCALDGPASGGDDAVEGRCAPVLDYGACDAPAWPVKDGTALDGDQAIARPDDLVRFDDVTVVDGALRLRREGPGVIELGDLCGLSGLQRVGGILAVTETDVTSLDGLQALASVSGGIVIADNASLVDVSALANLQFAPPPAGREDAVLLARNARLEPAAIEELRTTLRAVGIGVVDCGNAGALTPCTGAINSILDRL